MLDIKEGDVLVVGEREYPVKHVSDWHGHLSGRLPMGSFRRMATVTASTKRPPSVGIDGRRGSPVVNLSKLSCLPLDPVDPEIRQRLMLDTPHELLQTVIADKDAFYVLVLEDLKR